VKGLYKKAMAGEIKGFTGVDDPYEAPEHAEITVDSEHESIEESTDKIVRYLELKGLIPAAPGEDIPEAEEQAIRGRLKSLHFID